MPISISSESPANAAPAGLEAWVVERALKEGFDAAAIASPDATVRAGAEFHNFLKDGFHGSMSWLEAKADRRASPHVLWPDVRSIVMLALSYGPVAAPLAALAKRSHAAISVYAQGEDYHGIV